MAETSTKQTPTARPVTEYNIAIGPRAAYDFISGSYCVAIGENAQIPMRGSYYAHIKGVYDGPIRRRFLARLVFRYMHSRLRALRDCPPQKQATVASDALQPLSLIIPVSRSAIRRAVRQAFAAIPAGSP